jgi:SAM-dependent methyltransferase
MTTQTIPLDRPELTLEQRLMRLLTGNWVTQAISVAAELGVADRLADGARSCDELAQELKVQPVALYRLLRALAGMELFCELGDRTFANTPLSERLRSGVPGSLRNTAIMLGQEHYRAWGELLTSVSTGDPAFERMFGMGVFEYFDQQPVAADVFHRAMGEQARRTHLAAVEAYDFSRFGKLMDVGCGHGELLAAILGANPDLHGILFDLPSVVRHARVALTERGLGERVESIGGSFFEWVPAGADACIMSSVIHDWDDRQAIDILRNVYEALPPGGTVLLLERVLPGPNVADLGKLADLNMLVMTGGMERTEDEFRVLLKQAGFELERVIATKSSSCVIEGVRGE